MTGAVTAAFSGKYFTVLGNEFLKDADVLVIYLGGFVTAKPALTLFVVSGPVFPSGIRFTSS